jgi:hypothetical protein
MDFAREACRLYLCPWSLCKQIAAGNLDPSHVGEPIGKSVQHRHIAIVVVPATWLACNIVMRIERRDMWKTD